MNFIYKIDNLVNGKRYIGQTNYPERRWSQHKYKVTHGQNDQVVTRAMTKYGLDNFTFEVIASAQTQEDINVLEHLCIEQYDSRNPLKGYNVDVGGHVLPRTDEIRGKISKGLKEHYLTHEHHMKGKNHSEESKKKMSEVAMGKVGTNNGKMFDEQWKYRISQGQAGQARKSLRRFSDEVEQEICRLYVEEEMTTYGLGKKYECYRTLIDDILKRNGVEIRRSNYNRHKSKINIFTIEQETEICDMYKNTTMSVKSLGKKINCASTTLREILLRNKCELKKEINE